MSWTPFLNKNKHVFYSKPFIKVVNDIFSRSSKINFSKAKVNFLTPRSKILDSMSFQAPSGTNFALVLLIMTFFAGNISILN